MPSRHTSAAGFGQSKAEQKGGTPALFAKVHHRIGLEALRAGHGRQGRQAAFSRESAGGSSAGKVAGQRDARHCGARHCGAGPPACLPNNNRRLPARLPAIHAHARSDSLAENNLVSRQSHQHSNAASGTLSPSCGCRPAALLHCRLSAICRQGATHCNMLPCRRCVRGCPGPIPAPNRCRMLPCTQLYRTVPPTHLRTRSWAEAMGVRVSRPSCKS